MSGERSVVLTAQADEDVHCSESLYKVTFKDFVLFPARNGAS